MIIQKTAPGSAGFQHFGCLTNDKYVLLNIPALYDRRINCIASETNGTKWIGTDSGLFKLQEPIQETHEQQDFSHEVMQEQEPVR